MIAPAVPETPEQQKTLNAKVRGHYQYYGRPTNSQNLLKFYRGLHQDTDAMRRRRRTAS